jgi:hypothetical protein
MHHIDATKPDRIAAACLAIGAPAAAVNIFLNHLESFHVVTMSDEQDDIFQQQGIVIQACTRFDVLALVMEGDNVQCTWEVTRVKSSILGSGTAPAGPNK